jgi:hypothetical protein
LFNLFIAGYRSLAWHRKTTFYFHLKKSKIRFNYWNKNIYKQVLKMLRYQQPINSRAYLILEGANNEDNKKTVLYFICHADHFVGL